MNFEEIKDRVEALLMKIRFLYDSGEKHPAKEFVQASVMGEELFLKQTLFEIYYKCYMKSRISTNTLLDIYKNDLSSNEISADIVNTKEYAKIKRTYKSYREHNDNIAREFELFDQVELKDLRTIEDKMKGHEIKEFQKDQIFDLYEFEIFKHLKNKTIVDSNSVQDFRLIEMLNEINDIYHRIKTNNSTFFMRCFHYYQFEFNCRIETNYYIALILGQVDRTLKQKKEDINCFKSFYAVANKELYYQNRFILGIHKYIDKYLIEPDSVNSIPTEILQLSRIKSCLVDTIIEEIQDYQLIDFKEIEDLCENFFGRGQHIIFDKDWNEIKLRYFRDMYSSK